MLQYDGHEMYYRPEEAGRSQRLLVFVGAHPAVPLGRSLGTYTPTATWPPAIDEVPRRVFEWVKQHGPLRLAPEAQLARYLDGRVAKLCIEELDAIQPTLDLPPDIVTGMVTLDNWIAEPVLPHDLRSQATAWADAQPVSVHLPPPPDHDWRPHPVPLVLLSLQAVSSAPSRGLAPSPLAGSSPGPSATISVARRVSLVRVQSLRCGRSGPGISGDGRARGGIRTHTPFRTADFESAASAIPPPGPEPKSVACAAMSTDGSADQPGSHRRGLKAVIALVVLAIVAAAREAAFARNRR